jgi:RNA recognition motif-containing protein
VTDCVSPSLWIQYVDFIGGANFDVRDAAAVEAVLTVAARAVKQCGSDVAGGAAVWRAVQRVEILIANELGDEASVARVRQLALERAVRPLLDDDDVHREYLEWESSRPDADVAMACIESVQERVLEAQATRDSTLAPHEAAVRDTAVSDFERWPAWQEYLAAEQSAHAAPQHRVLSLFERALVPFCLFRALWDSYAAYVATHEPAQGAVVRIYERAVRNLPWTGELWASLIGAHARDDASSATIAAVVGRATQSSLESAADYTVVYFAALAALKARVVAQLGLQHDDSVAQQQPTLLEAASTSRVADSLADAAVFDESVGSVRLSYEQALGVMKGEGENPWRELREEARNVINWAIRFEFDIVARAPDDGQRRNMALNRVRMLYGELLSLFPRAVDSWLRAAEFEAHIGARARARALYSTGAGLLAPEHVIHVVNVWLAFEYVHGDDASAAYARQHGAPLIAQAKSARRKVADASAGAASATDAAETKPKKSKRREPNAARPDKKKRARRDNGADTDGEIDNDNNDGEEAAAAAAVVQPVEKKPKNRPPKEAVAVAEVVDDNDSKMKPPEQTAADASRREIVIRNVPFSMTVPQLRTLLGDFGDVDAMRLLTQPDGRSRGVAFCTYVTPEMARRAKRELANRKLDGRVLQVLWAKTDSNPIANEHDETLTVYVSNVHTEVTEQELRDAFAAVVAPRGVRRTVGKKFAFVEFVDQEAVQRALTVDGTQLRGQAIRVLRSDPSLAEPKPARTPAPTTQQPPVRKPTLLMPRSVARATASASTPSESTAAEGSTAPKSNADFRKFLLQK